MPPVRPEGIRPWRRDYRRRGRYSSAYFGVSKHGNRWYATVSEFGTTQYLGSFRDEELAAKQHDVVSIQMFNTRAWLNFPRSDYPDDL